MRGPRAPGLRVQVLQQVGEFPTCFLCGGILPKMAGLWRDPPLDRGGTPALCYECRGWSPTDHGASRMNRCVECRGTGLYTPTCGGRVAARLRRWKCLRCRGKRRDPRPTPRPRMVHPRCGRCKGTGNCKRCGGVGYDGRLHPRHCPACQGTGECSRCYGQGY